MIISHKHKFIFLKTSKTAGTSIEIALSKYCGEEDIITSQWYSLEEQELVTKLGYRKAQNFLIPFSQWTIKDIARIILNPTRFERVRPQFYNHMSSTEVKERISDDIWNSYFKFCFVRNPYDRLMSLYHWKRRSGSILSEKEKSSLKNFVYSKHISEMVERSWGIYTINDSVVVDHICSYEKLQEELKFLEKKLELPDKLELPNAKGNIRPKKTQDRDEIDQEIKDFIRTLCQKEIDHVGYVLQS